MLVRKRVWDDLIDFTHQKPTVYFFYRRSCASAININTPDTSDPPPPPADTCWTCGRPVSRAPCPV